MALRPEPPTTDPYYAALRGVTISRVVIDQQDVFDPEREPTWLFQTVNTFHVTTVQRVIERELLLRKGDLYDPELAQESERILRRLDFLADARVYPYLLEDGTAELRVRTRDRFTLRAGAGVGIFSGGSSSRFSLGESNLLGWGKDLHLSHSGGDQTSTKLSYKDPQFFTTHHTVRLSGELSDDGGNVKASFEQPFRTLETDYSYGADVLHSKQAVEYYRFGEAIAEVPVRTTQLGAQLQRAFGSRESRRKLGLRGAFAHDRFLDARGSIPDSVRVPGNTTRLEIGPTASLEYYPYFAEKTLIDSMGIIEDVPLGFTLQGFLGIEHRREDGDSPHNDTVIELGGQYSSELSRNQLVTFAANGRERLRGVESRAWSAAAQLHYYYLGFAYQTVAASLTYDGFRELDDLPPQLTLGEDSGLRGYEVRFFNGDRRVRFNLEDRIVPDLEVLSVRFGTVLFFDAGVVWNQGDPVSTLDIYKSAGVGLRIGSPEFIRGNVARIDLAFPLDDHPESDYRASLSVSVGQVFEIFGNSEGLRRDY